MAADISHESNMSACQWWEGRRLRYNIGLVLAGVLALIAYIIELAVFGDRIPGAEINLFVIALQAVGCLVFILLANAFYFLGALSERLPRMRSLESHRRLIYGWGFWFSVAVPFLGPLLVGYYAIFHPEAWQQSAN
jgi:hypothetical protein